MISTLTFCLPTSSQLIFSKPIGISISTQVREGLQAGSLSMCISTCNPRVFDYVVHFQPQGRISFQYALDQILHIRIHDGRVDDFVFLDNSNSTKIFISVISASSKGVLRTNIS